MPSPNNQAGKVWTLPPLILHPFADTASPKKLVQSSRANLILQGLLPAKDETPERLQEVLLEGRYCELKMLYYVGKDTDRWIEQCLEFVEREAKFRSAGLEWQSFACLLINETPSCVLAKLRSWGVTDHRPIFSRGLGLHGVFGEAPSREALTEDFLRDHHRYADELFACRKSANAYARANPSLFSFDLFASGEYASLLERQWQHQGNAK
jgi:hypothetical protein